MLRALNVFRRDGTMMDVERVHQGMSAFYGVALFAEEP
jgi:hypothetical protein